MKVDGLGVILAIILLPIILVVTYYIQLQVDTIAKENSYNNSLLNATYDAMSAFEVNTANEELSSVADSMRSLVVASNNILFNTLATNLGISNTSKEFLQPYVPAVLYTMYDGYYIFSPTEIPKVAEKQKKEDPTNGTTGESSELVTTEGYSFYGDTELSSSEIEDKDDNTVYGDVLYLKNGKYTVDPAQAEKKDDYILKSYVQYSANYKGQTDEKSIFGAGKPINVTINYTLDNYLNIVGTIGDVYYTKTGYLIKEDNNFVDKLKINNKNIIINNYNENDLRDNILGKRTNANETTIPAAESVSIDVAGETITATWNKIIEALNDTDEEKDYYKIESETGNGYANIRTISDAETYLEKSLESAKEDSKIQDLKYEIQKYKAIAYYASSASFSNWVYNNLGNLRYQNICDDSMRNDSDNKYSSTAADDLYYNFQGNDSIIFDRTEDPEKVDSKFNTHKIEVIKNSIKYNLNLCMSTYSNKYTQYEANLPVLLDEEWDKILNNISIVSFMQGLNCGLSIYNNYQIVSSTNNELTVTPSEIYYVKKGEYNNHAGYYHRIDCRYLEEKDDNEEYISFKSKEVKYDKVYNKASENYRYDHKNLACYTCINNSNYESLFVRPNSKEYYDRIASLNKKDPPTIYGIAAIGDSKAKKRAAYIGIANERQSIYKTNALPVSEGYRILYNNTNEPPTKSNSANIGLVDFRPINKLQITFSETKSKNGNMNRENVLKLKFQSKEINLHLDQKNPQTVIVDVSDYNDTNAASITFSKVAPDYDVDYVINSIKAIYK